MEVGIDGNLYIFQCPHCSELIQVEKNGVACGIFRHGYFYTNTNGKIELLSQVPPHASKNVCEQLLSENKVCGCCRPFRMVERSGKYIVEKCDYI